MNAHLSAFQITLLSLYAVGMTGGQLLFKLAAQRFPAEGSAAERVLALFANLPFLTAALLYAALTVLWVWILTFTPLSRGYPFVALAFALTPVVGALLFGEAITLRLLAGLGFILVGLLLVVG